RSFSRGVFLDISRSTRLPPVVSERPVGLRHPVCIILLLDRVALVPARRDQLIGQPIGHRLVTTLTRVADQPLHRQRRAPLRPNLDRNLVGGTTHTTAL